MEVAVAATFLGLPFFGWWCTRRATYVLLCGVLWVGLTGMVVEVSDGLGVAWTRNSLVWVVLASQICFGAQMVLARDVNRAKTHRWVIGTVGPLLLVCFALIVRIWVTHPKLSSGQSGVIVDLSYFTSGEDNAKWLEVLSHITQGDRITVGGVGGIIVVLSSMSWILMKAITGLLSLPWNEQSITLNSLFLLSVGPLVLSPLALVPLLESRDRESQYIRVICAAPAVLALWAMVANVRPLGHVTTEIVIVVLAFSVAVVGSEGTTTDEALMGVVLVGLGSTVWLGLRFVPLLMLALVMVALYNRGSQLKIKRQQALAGCVVLATALYPAWTTYKYTKSSPSTLNNLFGAGGAVVSVTVTTTILALGATVMGMTSLAESTPIAESRFRNLLPTALLSYSLFVVWSDMVRTGKINYGSLKLWYIVASVLLVAYLPSFLLLVHRRTSQNGVSYTAVGLVVSLLLIVSIDGVLTRSLSDLNTGIWNGATSPVDRTYLSAVGTYTESPQDLGEIPVGCVQYALDGTMLTSTQTYLCTRFLSSLAGLEVEAGPVVEWQLQQFQVPTLNPAQIWAKARPSLDGLPSDVKSRQLILFDDTGRVKGRVTIAELVQSFP